VAPDGRKIAVTRRSRRFFAAASVSPRENSFAILIAKFLRNWGAR
jgi:hypothetical protein